MSLQISDIICTSGLFSTIVAYADYSGLCYMVQSHSAVIKLVSDKRN